MSKNNECFQLLNVNDDNHFTQHKFDEQCGFGILGKTAISSIHAEKKMRKEAKVNPIIGFIPILGWLPKYNIRNNLINDMIGGFTVGIMHVPQGMAYASLTGMRPINGLFTSLFPPLLYMIFGTSRHVSIGVFAIVSLMVGSCNVRVSDQIIRSRNETLSDYSDDEIHAVYVSIAGALTCLVGLLQITMGVLRLDFLISFLSDQIICGFTTGAAFHVALAQMNKVLGVALPRHSGYGKLFMISSDLIRSIREGHMNTVTLCISLFTIVVLYCCKTYVNPWVKKRSNLPVPWELIVMFLGVIFSTIFDLHGTYAVKVVGIVPTGLPMPVLPDVTLFHYFIKDAIAISVIIVVVTVSMGKLFAKKHDYTVDVRQEFYALGLMESIASFFPVWPSSTAFARTLIYEAAGTKTQLATVFAASLLLSVILFLGPYVEVLPNCLLACIIIVALKGMFMQMGMLPGLWRSNKTDAATFVISMIATICLDIVEGLAVGVVFSLIVIIYRSLSAELVEIGEVNTENQNKYFRPIKEYSNASRIDGVCVVQFTSPLLFLNTEHFRKSLESIVAQHLRQENDDPSYEDKQVNLEMQSSGSQDVRHIVIDMTSIGHIDVSGAVCLHEATIDFEKRGILVHMFGAHKSVLNVLSNHALYEKSKCRLYPSMHDVMKAIEAHQA